MFFLVSGAKSLSFPKFIKESTKGLADELDGNQAHFHQNCLQLSELCQNQSLWNIPIIKYYKCLWKDTTFHFLYAGIRVGSIMTFYIGGKIEVDRKYVW